ncbi:class A beta-lactamase [Sphingomonas sp. SFZ2018-12]|uniref:class A beta-lactamase n=1 Tax=Sphingomonas sp. SFZ2018-12 TaxID=2683197 RepID=UPI001F0E483E|nr:class A beta-lactamase [Sphingomonas sp. SFZ2018-12]MCH4892985.1 class A beta-lactamase [Sphingomonas sp. SFZ2018-12]
MAEVSRRAVVAAGIGAGAAMLLPRALHAQARDMLGDITAEIGGRLGVSVFDTGRGWRLGIDPDTRYPLCSTFKLPLAAAILARADMSQLPLNRMIRYSEADLLDYAPAVRAKLAAGQMSVLELCEAAVVLSDNSAANLLLPQIGGPAGLTRFFRAHGDRLSRLDRDEPTLNIFRREDPRDTTTPLAMTMLMERLLIGEALQPVSRGRLIEWMVASQTGAKRLRAGLPKGWRTGDKTGTSGAGQYNDIAITWPPGGRKPILIAVYIDAPGLAAERADAAMARIGGLVGDVFGRG